MGASISSSIPITLAGSDTCFIFCSSGKSHSPTACLRRPGGTLESASVSTCRRPLLVAAGDCGVADGNSAAGVCGGWEGLGRCGDGQWRRHGQWRGRVGEVGALFVMNGELAEQHLRKERRQLPGRGMNAEQGGHCRRVGYSSRRWR